MDTIPSELLNEIGMDSGLFSQIGHLLELFGRAEAIAQEYKARRPDRPVMRLLKYTLPVPDMSARIPELYDAHVRELLERGIAFIDEEEKKAGHKVYVPRGKMRRVMEYGTRAEALLVMMKTSQAVPLHGDAGGLYFRLFISCFPKKVNEVGFKDVFEIGSKYTGHETFPGVIDQLEDEVRSKCAHDRDTGWNGNGGDRVKKWDDTAGVVQAELI